VFKQKRTVNPFPKVTELFASNFHSIHALVDFVADKNLNYIQKMML
jgi:hypothetical protein